MGTSEATKGALVGASRKTRPALRPVTGRCARQITTDLPLLAPTATERPERPISVPRVHHPDGHRLRQTVLDRMAQDPERHQERRTRAQIARRDAAAAP